MQMKIHSILMKILMTSHCCDEMGLNNSVNLNNINLDNNFDEDDPDTIRLWAWHIKFEKCKALKNDK